MAERDKHGRFIPKGSGVGDDALKITGADEVARALLKLIDGSKDLLLGAVNDVTEEVRTVSMDLTPKKHGTLRDSHRAIKARVVRGDIESFVVAGAAAEPYAATVHEFPDAHVPPSWKGKSADDITWTTAGTGPKFLERALFGIKFAEEVAKRVDIRRALR